MFNKTTLFTLSGLVIVAILASLAVWFYFLRTEQAAVQSAFEGRGFGDSLPSFEGARGSTNENIQATFLSRVGAALGFGDTATTTPTPSNDGALTFSTPRLWQVSKIPVAGIQVFGATSTLIAHFVERPTGHMFAANPYTGDVTRVTNTLIPRVHTAQWVSEDSVILAYVDEHDEPTYFWGDVQATTTAETNKLVGEFLESGITSLIPLPEEDAVFYVVSTTQGALGIKLKGEEERVTERLFTSAIRDWTSSHGNNGLVFTQNASQGIAGSAFFIDLNTSERTPLLVGVPGLTVASHPANGTLLYNDANRSDIRLFAHNESGGAPLPIPLKTLAEKCVFDPSESTIAYCAVPNTPVLGLPDAWYRGEVQFSDSLWRVDTEDGSVEMVVSFESDFSVSIDVSNMHMSDGGELVSFVDKRTKTAWVLRLSG